MGRIVRTKSVVASTQIWGVTMGLLFGSTSSNKIETSSSASSPIYSLSSSLTSKELIDKTCPLATFNHL